MTDVARLAEPFTEADLEWRPGKSGAYERDGKVTAWCMPLTYVAVHAIQDRLDEVCGPSNWTTEYKSWHEHGEQRSQLCGISIQVAPGNWVTKWDGAECPPSETIKGGLSNAFRRAAVLWGIGRYLYHLENTFAKCVVVKPKDDDKWKYAVAKAKSGQEVPYWWQPPPLPEWAKPKPV